MTREEALEALTNKDVCNPNVMLEALDMAIEALKQEPCDDAISRKKTLEPYKDLKDDDVVAVWLIKKNIEQQVSVTPTHGKMLVCPNCGLDVHSDFENCPRCGERMKNE